MGCGQQSLSSAPVTPGENEVILVYTGDLIAPVAFTGATGLVYFFSKLRNRVAVNEADVPYLLSKGCFVRG